MTGLGSNESLVQIDYRPATANYYCLTNQARVCTVNPETGAASVVSATAFTTETLVNPVIDFNPVVDRLRLVASQQNLRVNPIDGKLVETDTDVFYDSGDVNDDINPQLAAVAYDRNRSGASSTTLFALDVTTQSLVRIGSRNGTPDAPNGGKLFTIAKVGTPFTTSAGFDIEPDGDTAYALLAANGAGAALFRIDLSDGSADRVGTLDDGDRAVISLAVGPERDSGGN